ncbi:hypothetical protein [uncultured Amphritea sp.]|uniref:hypothetical protein n=1 Tax=uncultured Amphritea sp. TaxID=981605 RepID=UPI0026216E23|nr:hypothetical protein [uncultured Amphritea sp.]
MSISYNSAGLPIVNPDSAFSGDQGASTLLGNLSRAQWEDWKLRFQPYIGQLSDMATDENAGNTAALQAQQAVGLSFDNSVKTLKTGQSDLGISLDATETATQNRNINLNRAATQVDAMNSARVAAEDRKQKILAGDMGLSNIPGKVVQQM